MKIISLVVPAYNEEAGLGLFLMTTLAVVDRLAQYEFRVYIVNDGSRDNTLDVALRWREKDPRIVVVNLSRNFGHEAALSAGLGNAIGDAVIVMDADLQDPPELIEAMITRWEEGFDVVNGHRASRKEDSFMKRWTAGMFYKLINRFSGKVRIPENVGNFRLISRRVLDLYNSLPEKNRVFRVLIPYLGFSTASVDYVRPVRAAGKTHYNYSSMIRLAVDGITSATIIPLQFSIKAGMFFSGVGFVYLLWVVVQAFVGHNTVPGWASLMSVVLFLGGIQLISLGVISAYIGRIFLEVKERPSVVTNGVWGAGKDADPIIEHEEAGDA
jgi:polyisoprenyl-phosphate glycosyltransferase